MVRFLTFGVATLGTAAVLCAQTPAAPGPPEPPTMQRQAEPAIQVSPMMSATQTWRGCLKPGPIAGTWILDNAHMTLASGTQSAPDQGAVGTGGAPRATTSAKRAFDLNTKPTDDLTPHARHQIEVVGTRSPATSNSPPT